MRHLVFHSCLVLFIAIAIDGKVITVPDQVPSIQGAIDKADEGDTVSVRIGTWKESVVLKDGVALIGESMAGTVLQGRRRGPVVCGANGSLIKSLTITRGRTGILCENVDMTIEQVIVRGNSETGIHCLVSLPNIYNSIIYRNRASGIFCEGTRSIKTSVMHNIIAENGYSGITLQGVSEVLIQNNVFLGNRDYAVWGAEEARRSRIIYNDFYANRSNVNIYLALDISNIGEDPGYPRMTGDNDFFSTASVALKGRGKDGATIGLIGGEVLTQKLTDPDEDGVTGTDDKCPSIPEDKDGFEDNDGCPEFDNDKDGIFDDADGCPNSAEDYDNFRDDDGCFDSDNDKDGVPDSVDICKNNPETPNGYKDDDGCPDELPPSETGTALPLPKAPEVQGKPYRGTIPSAGMPPPLPAANSGPETQKTSAGKPAAEVPAR